MYPQSGVAKIPQHRLSLLLGKEMAMPGSVTRSSSELARSECLPVLAFLFDAYFRNKGLFSEILLLTSGPKEDNSDMVLVIDKREGQNLTPRPHVKMLGMVVCKPCAEETDKRTLGLAGRQWLLLSFSQDKGKTVL